MGAEAEAGTATWRELCARTEQLLRGLAWETAPNEARWLIEEAAGDRLEAVGDERATPQGMSLLDAMTARRSFGEPLQYVLGHWPFRSLDLLVDRRVLIPRSETEVVAGIVIEEVNRRGPGSRVVDLGTGSGAIALSVAAECEGVEVWATDRNAEALEVARTNCVALGRRAAFVTFAEGPWFDALPVGLAGSLDVVVSNPPYVTTSDSLPESVERWEPADALRAGADGLDDVRTIIAGALEWLSPSGVLACEIDPRQAGIAAELAMEHGFAHAEIVADLSGRDRALVARRD